MHTMLHSQFDRFFEGFRRDAHPMSIMVGIGRGAKEGILIRDAAALEALEKIARGKQGPDARAEAKTDRGTKRGPAGRL